MTITRAEQIRLREQLRELIGEPTAIPRIARGVHRCVCADETRPSGKPNPNYRPDCIGDIDPTSPYVDYVGEAAMGESGRPYCTRCGIAVWGKREVSGA